MKSNLESFQQSDLLFGTLLDVGHVGRDGKKYFDTPAKGWLLVTEAGVGGCLIQGNFHVPGKGTGYGGLINPKFEAEMLIRIKHGELSPYAILLKHYPSLLNLKGNLPAKQCDKKSPETGNHCTMETGHAGPHLAGGPYHSVESWITKCPEGKCEYHPNSIAVGPRLRWEECVHCGHIQPFHTAAYTLSTSRGTLSIYATTSTEAGQQARSFLRFTRISAHSAILKPINASLGSITFIPIPTEDEPKVDKDT